MQILKGSKERLPDKNPFVYSGGSVYRDDNLDRMTNNREACKKTIDANSGYEGASEEFNKTRMAMVDNILNRYPPQFSDSRDLVEIDGEMVRWSPEALLVMSNNVYQFNVWKRSMDYRVVQHSELEGFTHHDQEWKDRLEEELTRYQQLINPEGE